MSAAGIIFSNIHDRALGGLTLGRTVASVPFLCRYRLIDLPLSAMVNADIANIGIITHKSYHSLMDHIGSGKDFDLDRRCGGVRILPPYISGGDGSHLYRTRLEALIGILPYINELQEELVVMSDCNTVANMDLRALLEQHKSSGAHITVAVTDPSAAGDGAVFYLESDGRVCDILCPTPDGGGGQLGVNTLVMSTDLLRYLITDAAAHGYTDFVGDVLRRGIPSLRIHLWKCEGPVYLISSPEDYFSVSMELVRDREARRALFSVSERPIYTRSKSSPPTLYSESAAPSSSLIADGCKIRGRVEDSVIFRGVHIGEGAVVRSCVIMQDTVIGEGVQLDHVICDIGAVIRDGRTLSGAAGTPFYISKGRTV